MPNIVRHNSQGTLCRGPSPALWGDLNLHNTDALQGKNVFHYNDFAPGVNVTTNATTRNVGPGYVSFADNGPVIIGTTDTPNLSEAQGELVTSTLDGVNEEVHLQFTEGNPFRVDLASGNSGAFYYETRFKVGTIASNTVSVFFGLASGTVAADYMVDATGVLKTDQDFIGFRTLDGGATLEFVYQAASATLQDVGDAHTLVADDYVKVGFSFDPNALDEEKIKVYVNGVEDTALRVTRSDIEATTFPEDVSLAPVWLNKNTGAAVARVVTCDWVGFSQYGDSGAAN